MLFKARSDGLLRRFGPVYPFSYLATKEFNVRVSHLIATGLMAASVALTACSSGGSSAVPGGSQAPAGASKVSPTWNHVRKYALRFSPGVTCPLTGYKWQYKACYDITYGTPTTYTVCVRGGGMGCTIRWNWSQVLYTPLHHAKSFRIRSSFSPNPGSPTTVTANERFPTKNPKAGSVKYISQVQACNPRDPSMCLSAPVGFIPQNP
jgi:hypothetical protein